MNTAVTLTQTQLSDFLLNVAVVRPVFIWGPPGIGKSALVQNFASSVGLDCVSLLGSQLAPEDLIGVPQIIDGKSVFCPPRTIARETPYCLFLDELNACSHEVQKAFYSLIHEGRLGEYELPKGSIVIGAGNRSQDSAIVRQMSSALLNRMMHVHLQVSHRDWLAWAYDASIHPLVTDYIQQRPDHLWSKPPKHEEPFSTPRAWHMLSDALHEFGDRITDHWVHILASGCLSPAHATQFRSFVKQIRGNYTVHAIIKGDQRFPTAPEDRDVLYFLAHSFRAHLIRELPVREKKLNSDTRHLTHRSKLLIKELAQINFEMAQLVVTDDDSESLPNWFIVEIVRDLPRLAQRELQNNEQKK